MLLDLIPGFPSLTFTAGIGDISVRTDFDSVELSLTTDNGSHEFFSETYAPYEQRVVVHDLRSIVEQALRELDTSLATFTLRADAGGQTVETDFTALYCDRDTSLSPLDIIGSQFLTTLPVRTVSRLFPQPLHYVLRPRGQENFTLRKLAIHCILDTGEQRVVNKNFGSIRTSGAYILDHITIDYGELTDLAKAALDDVGFRVAAVTVDCGNRSATLYYSNRKSLLRFYFRNQFNVVELAELAAVTTAKTAAKSSEAVCNGSLQLYDRSAEQSFEVEADGLSLARARWLGEMLTSRDVRITEQANDEDDLGETYPQVQITDSTCEISDSDENLCKLKFTYRYAGQRPQAALKSTDRIHQDSFKNPFN